MPFFFLLVLVHFEDIKSGFRSVVVYHVRFTRRRSQVRALPEAFFQVSFFFLGGGGGWEEVGWVGEISHEWPLSSPCGTHRGIIKIFSISYHIAYHIADFFLG